MKACPKCGSQDGWALRRRCTMVTVGPWGSGGDETYFEHIRDPKTVACVNCGARIDRISATGEAHEKHTK